MATKKSASTSSNSNPGTSVAHRKPTAVSTPISYEDVPTGLEGADRDSYMIPFLQILQKLSPQLDKGSPAYIKGAEDGDILNTATNETYPGAEGILVLPVSFKRSYTLWAIREKGGGFKGEQPVESDIMAGTNRDDKNRNILKDGVTQVVDTRVHAVILIGEDGDSNPALLSMTSTQIKKSRRWMTAMQRLQDEDKQPTLAHVWKLTTVSERNDKGNWSGWNIEHVEMNQDQDTARAAVAFSRALTSGTMKIRTDIPRDHDEE